MDLSNYSMESKQDRFDYKNSSFYSRHSSMSMMQSFVEFVPSDNISKMLKATGIVGCVFMAVSMILSLFLYFGSRGGFMGWISFVYLLAGGAFGANFYFGKYLDRYNQHYNEGKRFRLLACLGFLIAILVGVSLAVLTLVVLYYRWIHFNMLMRDKYSDGWKLNMRQNSTFEQSWNHDRALHSWTAFFSILGALLCGVIAYLYWTTLRSSRIRMEKGLFSAATCISMVFACCALYKAMEAGSQNMTHPAMNGLFSPADMGRYYWGLLLFIFVLVVGLVINLSNNKFGYFTIGFVLLFITIIFSIKSAYNLRFLRRSVDRGEEVTLSCVQGLDLMHEMDLEDYCNKYLPKGAGCNKNLQKAYWEKDNSPRMLDPICARVARVYFLWPVYLCGLFSIFAFGFAAVVIYCSFYLWDDIIELQNSTFEYTHSVEAQSIEYISLGASFLVFLIAFMIFIVGVGGDTFRNKPITRTNTQLPTDASKPVQRIEGFKIVPSEIISGKSKVQGECVPYSTNTLVKMADPSNCPFTRCGYRLFILGEFTSLSAADPAFVGTSNMRSIIFPMNTNSLDGFLFLKGTTAELNDQLSKVKLCPNIYSGMLALYFKAETVNLDSLSPSGLKSDEDPAAPALSPKEARDFPTYTEGSSVSCSNSCENLSKYRPSTQKVTVNVKIEAKTISDTFDKVQDYLADRLKIEVYHNDIYYLSHSGGLKLTPEGLFSFQLPVSTNLPYTAKIVIIDEDDETKGYKLSAKEVIIPTQEGTTVDAGTVYLHLPSGRGCMGSLDFEACVLKNQQPSLKTFSMKVIDGVTNQPIQDVPLLMLEGLVSSGETYKRVQTDSSGIARFSGVPPGTYTILPEGDKYQPASDQINMQGLQDEDSYIYLFTKAGSAMDVTLELEKERTDSDLRVKFKSTSGKECQVSSFYKYCGYAFHLRDVKDNESGVETIRIRHLSNSLYLAYVLTAPPPGAEGCIHWDVANHRHFASVADSTNVPVTIPPYDQQYPYHASYCFTGYGKASVKYINEDLATEPSVDICAPHYPPEDPYSLENLEKALAAGQHN